MVNMRNLTRVPSWMRAIGRVWRATTSALTHCPQPPVPYWMASKEGADTAVARPWATCWAGGAEDPGGWDGSTHGPPRIIFGHDARRRLQKHPNALGLDTGCLYGNGLTGLHLPDNVLMEAPSRRVYVLAGKKYVPPPVVTV